jgi:hypothetical protein
MREIANKQESGAQSVRKFYIAGSTWTNSERLKVIVQAASRRGAMAALKNGQWIDILDESVGDYEGQAKDIQIGKVVKHEV